jgi:signal recognition particle receptor subunit beta
MATVHLLSREISAAVLYMGPTGAGSGTNVRRLYELVPAASRSRLHRFGPRGGDERTWYFDYVSAAPFGVRDFQLRVHVYSLPASIDVAAHREEVLRDVDGLVFVADARPEREGANADELLAAEGQLSAVGLALQALPVVLQVNHTDHAEARAPADVAFALNPYGFPVVPATAREDRGVLETHEAVLRVVAERIRDALSGVILPVRLRANVRPDADRDDAVVQRHIEAIRRAGDTGAAVEAEEVAATAEVRDGGEVSVPFMPNSLVGYRPVHVVGTRVVGDEVFVELIVRNHRGDSVLVHVQLEARPVGASPSMTQPMSMRSAPWPVTAHLPESMTISEPQETGVPAWLWGAVGVVGGSLVGALAIYVIAG